MRLAISTNIFAALPIKEAFERMGAIGIRDIEVHALHLSTARNCADAAARALDREGLRVSSVHSPTMDADFLGKTSPRFKKDYRAYYAPFFETAARLGAGIFVDHLDKANDRPKDAYESLKMEIFENLRLLAELAAGFKVTVALENCSEDNCLYSPEQFREILDRVDHIGLKVNLDVRHAMCNHIDPQRFSALVGGSIINLHTQNIEIAGLVKALEQTGYRGALVLEHEEKKLREAFRGALEKIGKLGLNTDGVNAEAVPVLNDLRVPRGWRS